MLNTAYDSSHLPAQFLDRTPSFSWIRRLRRVGLAILAVGTLAIPASALAQDAADPQDFEPKIFLHVVSTESTKRINCYSHGVGGSEDVVTAGTLTGEGEQYLIYVLATDFYPEWGVAGIQFGIAFNDEPGKGIDIDVWQNCSDIEWRKDDWPLAGTGNLLTWQQSSNCQTESPVVVGFFVVDVHSPDKFRLIPRPVDGIASIVSCGINLSNAEERTFTLTRDHLGMVEFGTDVTGYNPWDPEQFEARVKSRSKK